MESTELRAWLYVIGKEDRVCAVFRAGQILTPPAEIMESQLLTNFGLRPVEV